MYLWKCWRDARSPFFLFLGLVVCFGLPATVVLRDLGGWTSARDFPAGWYEAARTLAVAPLGFIYLAAFLLGGATFGEEYTEGTLPFLLTRPRSRSSLVWINWLTGALLLEALVTLALAFYHGNPSPPGYPRGPLDAFDYRRIFLSLLVPLFLFTLTFFFTILLRSPRNGIGAAMLATFGYMAVSQWLSLSYNIRLPYAPEPFVIHLNGFPWGEMTAWLTASLAVVGFSQRVIVLREV